MTDGAAGCWRFRWFKTSQISQQSADKSLWSFLTSGQLNSYQPCNKRVVTHSSALFGSWIILHVLHRTTVWIEICVCGCTELKGLGADFVFGFVQSMDGEKDPRNLLLAFQVAKNIIHQGYDLGESTCRCAHTCSIFLSLVFSVALWLIFEPCYNPSTVEAWLYLASH